MRACAHVLNLPAQSKGDFRRGGSSFPNATGHQSQNSTAHTCVVSCQHAASRCARREDGRPTRARLHVRGIASRLRSAETSDDSLSLALVAAGRASENPQHAPSHARGTYAPPTTHLPRIFLVRELSCAAVPQAGGAVLEGNAALHRERVSKRARGGTRRKPRPQW